MFYYSIDRVLDINDLDYVLDTLIRAGFSGSKWKRLGRYLGLDRTTRSNIEVNHPGDEQRCLRECLVKWLERADGVDARGGPTMTSLCRALEIIDERAAADYISKLLLY